MTHFKSFDEFFAEKLALEGATLGGPQQPGQTPAGPAAPVDPQRQKAMNQKLAMARLPMNPNVDQAKVKAAQQVMQANNGDLDMDSAMSVAQAMQKAQRNPYRPGL